MHTTHTRATDSLLLTCCAVMAAACLEAGPADLDALESDQADALVTDEDLMAKALMVVDPSVVDSAEAASRLDDPQATGFGAWSFGRMLQSMAGDGDPAVLAEQFMTALGTRQTVNGFVSMPTLNLVRGSANDVQEALDSWCRTPAGKLDLARAPFRLLAVVNRPDLRQSTQELGELRFVFSLLQTSTACRTDPTALPEVLGGTGVAIIFEFAQPKASCWSQRGRALAWRALAQQPFGAAYNTALKALTEAVLNLRDPARPNRSQLNQLRINSGASPSEWFLRDFHLGGRTPNLAQANNLLVMVPPAASPDFATMNDTAALRTFTQEHAVEISAGTLMFQPVPDAFMGQPFGAAVSGNLENWQVSGLPSAGFKFMTCGGCHAHQTAGPHVGVGAPFPALVGRERGEAAGLSDFMANFEGDGELARRAAVLNALANGTQCSSVEAHGVVSSMSPRTVSPQDVLWVNTVSEAPQRTGNLLRLYRVGDADSARPLGTLNVGTTTRLLTSRMTAPALPGTYEVRLFSAAEPGRFAFPRPILPTPERRLAVGRPITVALNHGYTVTLGTVPTGGQDLSVFWTAAPDHSSLDMVGLFQPGSADAAPVRFVRTGAGEPAGNMAFGTVLLPVPMGAGTYEVRMVRAMGARVAQGDVFTVR
jgi:hypothetical protein